MGLPIHKLIIATNKNDILRRGVKTGLYKPMKVHHTVSPSMDIQVASNFERLIFDVCSQDSSRTLKLMGNLNKKGEFEIENKELIKIKDNFTSESLSEEETKLIINKVYKREKILIDPHTAVGLGVLEKISLEGNSIILATAHPSKFSEVVTEATNLKPELPEKLKNILIKKESYEKLPNDIKIIQNYILKKI